MSSSRRQFLYGTAGFTLAIPFLDSIADKDAAAGVPPYATHPRFVCMTTQHGGVWGANMFPGDEVLDQSMNLYPGHVGRHGSLVPNVSNGTASLSPVLTASTAALSAPLASKMNVIRGLDVPHLGHHTGGCLGNFAGHFDMIDPNNPVQIARPTIDQVMAYSPSFYPDLSTIRQRSLHIGTHTHHCWGHANPSDPSSAVQAMPLSQSSQALFDLIFEEETDPEETRPLVVDRVVEHYRRLRHGTFGDARRLSSHDARRLDDHMDRLLDLQTRLGAVANCGDVPQPTVDTQGLNVNGYSNNVGDMREFYSLYNDVIAAAFICGTSRVAVINSGETWSTQLPGLCCDWHQQVAHRAHEPDGARQEILADAKRDFFESVFLDLVNKLDVEEANGVTYLDNSLVFWTQESGATTHDAISLPIVSAGSGAGYFETGNYIDYRNRNNTSLAHDYSPEHNAQRPGLPYQRFLGNVLTGMGVSANEYERPGEHGYGDNHIRDFEELPQQYMDDASLPLPVFVG